MQYYPSMASLEPPDTFYLRAASGWLDLGDYREARAEIARISQAHQNHPDVIEIRWHIHASMHQWDAALELGEILVAIRSEDVQGWIHRAYAMRRASTGGLRKAWAALQPAVTLFPEVAVIPYNIACYAAQLDRLDESWQWLEKAIAIDGVAAIKEMALADPDLEPLWKEIRKLR
jgi:tetratricopeptide (TPR) repeat protein